MTVRSTFRLVTACLAVLGMLVLSACGDREGAPLPAETDEPFYVQGKTLVRQGRHPEALTSFLKVIERRGERGAAESHLEAGSIYLYYTKDPVEAYHHFRRYLALQPNSKEAAGVKGKVEEAKREFARTLPARPLEDQSLKLQADETLEKLRRENEELRAQNATLRGGSNLPVSRAAPMISLPEEAQPRQPPPPVNGVADGTAITAAPQAAGSAPVRSSLPTAPTPSTSTTRTAVPPPSTPSSARTHRVAPKETLYGISMKYYGNGRQVDAIYQANRDQMRSREDVRPGMTLRLPNVDGAGATRR